jgi:hypothetical protein
MKVRYNKNKNMANDKDNKNFVEPDVEDDALESDTGIEDAENNMGDDDDNHTDDNGEAKE